MNSYLIVDSYKNQILRKQVVKASDMEAAQEIYLEGVDASGGMTGELYIARVFG